MDNNQDWLELYQQRDQWAIIAYEKFINQVDDALKADLTRSDQITIVVYGSTQVGKTSLILKILGVNDAHMSEVSTLLRGGREIGKSATIMPIRYRKSTDNQWHIHDIQGRDTTVSTVEEYFKNLRASVEKGQINTTNIVDVYIPQYYFAYQSEGMLDIRILDLPGIQAKNENEQIHVQQISTKYAANADLILLVGRSDDLAFINPSRLILDQFKYWTSQTSRFRVILTRAFSPATVIDYIKKNQDTFNLDTFKDRIFQQLKTHDFPVPQECQDIIFPLEFGDSLANIQEKHPEYFELIDNVNQQSFKLLHEGICKAANPYARFKNGFDVQRLAKIRINEEKERFKENDEKFSQELRDLRTIISKFEQEIEDVAQQRVDCQSNDEYFRMIQEEYSLDWFQIQYEDLANKCYTIPYDTAVSSLKEIAKVYTRYPKLRWFELVEYFDKNEEDLNFSFGLPPELDVETFKVYDEKLNGYRTDFYWSESNFQKDYQMLKTALIKEGKKFSQEAWMRLTKYTNQQRAQLKNKYESLDNRLKQILYGLKKKQDELFKLQQQKNDLKICHQSFIARMATAEQHGKSFEEVMKISFEQTCLQSKNAFFNEQDPIKKFYRLWYSMLLETQYDEMMLGVK